MYDPVPSKASFPEMECSVLQFWQTHDTFRRSLDQRRDAPGSTEFVFYDGPPFATGLPHYGHLLAGTIKDIVPRYRAMRGCFVERRFGWDCHGLPVEYEVEQSLNISGKSDIEALGVEVFNEKCRSIVLRHTAEWRKTVTRMGRWVDFDRDYKTMDPSYMESIWWVFKSLWGKQLVYEGQKILPYCPRCATPLSNFETNQGYMDVSDPAITIRFRVDGEENTYLLAWTTTPWTLPSNMALAVGPDIDYVRVKDGKDCYLLAEDRLRSYYRKDDDYDSLSNVKGRDLVGLTYEPLFPYFAAQKGEGAFRVLAADFVTTEDGTGIVHMAPGFGEDDYRVGQAEGIPVVCPVDDEGRFTAEVTDYVGRKVKDTDDEIIARLKTERKLVHRATITHSYPHCWRCDTPLIYRGISTWFVNVERIKDRMIELNREIRWVPGHLRDGRFGKWLEGSRDWAISRNRYWGTPLPVWRSDDGEELLCIGSIAELEDLSGHPVKDLHKHHVDSIEIPSREGRGTLRRVPEVLDCWFESGAMPYAQAHYPFENQAHFESHFPADFIAEGLDQTRGWFYTLMVLSTALFDRPAFRNVIVNGLVLAEDGRKMSKRLKNYPDPEHILNTYGADAVRLYLINSAVVKGEDLRFSEDGVKQLLRHILIPLWNAYSFFVTYANIDGWTPSEGPPAPAVNVLDRWIRSSLESLVRQVVTSMDAYELQSAVRPFVQFIEDLTNWYIRRSRRRFWKSQSDTDKAEAYATLHYVLLQLSRVTAPFIPFISEAIFRNLRTPGMPDSVHLCDFPMPDEGNSDPDLERQMADVMTVVRLGRLLRSEHDLKVRQPLSAIHVVSNDEGILRRLTTMQDILLDELNVKSMLTGTHEAQLAHLKAKPNYRVLGPRFGARIKSVGTRIAALTDSEVEQLLSGETLSVEFEGGDISLAPGDIIVERVPRQHLVVASEGQIVVALETEVDDALLQEGIAREEVNRIQSLRKTLDLDLTQRIRIEYADDADTVLRAVHDAYREYIQAETLCTASVYAMRSASQADWQECNLNGHRLALRIIPADA